MGERYDGPDVGMHDTEIPDDDEGGPFTCCQCCAPTWNDDDWCDDCRDPTPNTDRTT